MAKRGPVKPVKKSARKSPTMPTLIPQPNGRGALLSGGIPGLPSNGGRPRDEWKAQMRKLADAWQKQEVAGAVVADPSHPHWMSAGKYVTDQGYGAPPKPVEITGAGGEPLVIRVVRET